jgi:hypothetical protein
MLSDRIGKIEKARQYSLDAGRFTVADDLVLVRGDHGDHTLKRDRDDWVCSCDYYRRHKWCAHTLAFEWYTGARPSVMG